eukprot:TRINITY_DN11937_c0_g1_i1.p1 TRINITY_DN11937_c0_g1~~TRINITY_DN11937_c0_g1_i1.p1  ORF type:complete len:319 (+),score=69.00 TRINITY_DN11937_c0_g1_i1:162-1118(+)
MDSSIIPTRFPDIFQVSTTDFFFPLVEDPYIQGKIACANVLSDMYAVGVTHCDNLLMLLGVCDKMSVKEQDIVTEHMMRGFCDLAKEANTRVTGGQTVINAWPLVGGVAMSCVKRDEIIMPEAAVAGDVLILTKPLGTQVAVNVHQWLEEAKRWDKIKDVISKDEALDAYDIAMSSMARLNKVAAELMHKHKAHACTDVTGFGVLGHADNLSQNQKADVDFVLESLPIIKKMKEVDDVVNIFNLVKGTSAETSGGLLIALPKASAQQYLKDLSGSGEQGWIVGKVTNRTGTTNHARLSDSLNFIDVSESATPQKVATT